MNWKQFFIGSVAVLVAVGCGAEQKSAMSAPEVKQFSATAAQKYIASLKGKVVVVNFWATWCGPCRMEIPGFVKLQDKYGPQGLQIVGLSMDEISPAKVAAFTQKSGINYPVHIVGNDTMKAWGDFEAIPMTFILDANGKRVWQHEGYASPDDFEKHIKSLLPPK